MEIMERPFIDIRAQVADALAELGYETTMEYPVGDVILPRITYAQIANSYLSPSTQRLVYQVDIWTNSIAQCLDIASKVNDVMDGMNFRLTYENPDTSINEDINLYHKALSFEATADLVFKRLM